MVNEDGVGLNVIKEDGCSQYLALAFSLSTTVTEEVAILGVRQVMIFVADFGTHSAHTHTVHHLASMAMVPGQR